MIIEWYHDENRIGCLSLFDGELRQDEKQFGEILLSHLPTAEPHYRKKIRKLKVGMMELHIKLDEKYRVWKGRRNHVRTEKKQGLYSSYNSLELGRLTSRYFTLREPRGIFRIGTYEFIPLYICPHCGHCHTKKEIPDIYTDTIPTARSVSSFYKSHPQRRYRHWLTDKTKRRCSSCHKYFIAKIKTHDHTDTFRIADQLKTIRKIDLWYKEYTHSQKSLFCEERGTQRIMKDRVFLYWDDFLAVQGLENCPDELLDEIVHSASLRELEGMLNGKKGVKVFSHSIAVFENGVYKVSQFGSL